MQQQNAMMVIAVCKETWKRWFFSHFIKGYFSPKDEPREGRTRGLYSDALRTGDTLCDVDASVLTTLSSIQHTGTGRPEVFPC